MERERQGERSAERDRRRHDLAGRVARATYPIRFVANSWIGDFPCNIIGHHWVEIPKTFRISATSDGSKMRFKCSRCYLIAGFSNRALGD
jgi:hypothetical protein